VHRLLELFPKPWHILSIQLSVVIVVEFPEGCGSVSDFGGRDHKVMIDVQCAEHEDHVKVKRHVPVTGAIGFGLP